MLSTSDALKVVEPVLKSALEPMGFEEMTLKSGYNHDGEAALFATIKYNQSVGAFEASTYLSALSKAIDELAALGDDRFIYVEHDFGDKDTVDYGDRRPRQKSRS